MDWGIAKAQAKSIIANNGEAFQWLVRSFTETNQYDVNNTGTYGYGDPVVTYETGSLVAIMEPIRETDVHIEAGFYADDYKRVYVDPDTTLSQHDLLIYPSGTGIKYLVLPEKTWDADGYNIVHIYMIRRLVPRSGSYY